MQRRILVIEDEEDLAELLALHLRDVCQEVRVTGDGAQGLAIAESGDYDLIILDLMLPGMPGLDVCRRLRAQSRYTPILMLTARSSEIDRVLGLELGADDYLTKPFSLMELNARVKAIFRRLEALAADSAPTLGSVGVGELHIEVEKRRVTFQGRPIELTRREFELLLHFCLHPGRVYTRAQLLDAVWGYGHAGYEHTVNSHINRLRAKIEEDPAHPCYILTVWGVGYRFTDSAGEAEMLSTLYARLALVLLVLFFGLGVGFLLITRFVSTTYQQEVSQKMNRDLAAHIVAEHRLIGNDGVNRPALQEVFHYMMVVNPAIEVYLLDPEGLILADAAPPGKVKRPDVSLAPVRTLLNPNARLPILGDDPRNPAGRKVFSVAPVEEAGQLRGYVYVILSGETQEGTAELLRGSYILQLGAWAIVACLLFALLAGLLLFGLLTRRLRHMASAVAAFEASNFAAPLAFLPNPAGRDEIDRLGTIVHAMSARIIDQLRKLARTDTMRRELVANVSHDLRTPLSAMQGYLETLLTKGDSLTVEEQRRYLQTAKRHGDRLEVLVAHMFELAKLDSRETLPQCEPHLLGELMQDVAQKYELYARERGVRIETELQHDAPFVNADIAMIERVFENLIENALRYTQEGGVVRLALGTDRRRVQVAVSDTGSGIPPERLPYIFDRFYHSEDTPPEKSRSAGLGLAIVKRILELHGSAISVVSNPAAGTTFSFDLPATR